MQRLSKEKRKEERKNETWKRNEKSRLIKGIHHSKNQSSSELHAAPVLWINEETCPLKPPNFICVPCLTLSGSSVFCFYLLTSSFEGAKKIINDGRSWRSAPRACCLPFVNVWRLPLAVEARVVSPPSLFFSRKLMLVGQWARIPFSLDWCDVNDGIPMRLGFPKRVVVSYRSNGRSLQRYKECSTSVSYYRLWDALRSPENLLLSFSSRPGFLQLLEVQLCCHFSSSFSRSCVLTLLLVYHRILRCTLYWPCKWCYETALL